MSMEFWRGFRAAAPLWLGAFPFAIAYVLAAEAAGIPAWEIQGMSLLLSSAATQIVIVQSQAAPLPSVILTVFLMHLHYVLYGLSLKKQIKMTAMEKAVAAYALTDFGFAMSQTVNATLGFLFGIELGVFLAWNFYTGAALLFRALLPNIESLQLDFIIPLSFLVLLVSSIKRPLDLLVAIFALALTWVALGLGFGQFTTPFVILLAPVFGLGLKKLCS